MCGGFVAGDLVLFSIEFRAEGNQDGWLAALCGVSFRAANCHEVGHQQVQSEQVREVYYVFLSESWHVVIFLRCMPKSAP